MKILISCPSLWTCLDCKNVDKTCVYLKRSKASALKIRLGEYLDEAFHLTIPCLGQLGSLSLLGSPDHLRGDLALATVSESVLRRGGVLICPRLEELHMDIEREDWFCIGGLL